MFLTYTAPQNEKIKVLNKILKMKGANLDIEIEVDG